MVKRFIQFILFLLLLLLIFLVYLSIYGISTNKFNNLISEKIADKNKDLDINLNEIKIFLNINNFNFELKTNDPKVFFKNKEIKIKSISTDLPLKNFFSKKINFKEIKILTYKNKIKNVIDIVRAYQNSPQLFILSKVVKDGTISIESKIKFNQDGSIKKNYLVDGNIEDLKIKLLNDNLIENLNTSFLIRDNEYLIYNLSLIYQSLKLKSNQIKIVNNQNNLIFDGDISNKKGIINLEKFLPNFNINYKNILDNLSVSSNNKFSFKLSKKMKLEDIKFQSKISFEELNYSNDIFKRFFPGYRKNIKVENNSITFDYNNGDYQLNGRSKLNINGDIDDVNYSIKKIKKQIFYDFNFELVNSAINFKILNYTKNKDDKSFLKIKGKYTDSKLINFENIKFVEGKNSIDIQKINLNKNKKIKSIDDIKVNVLNNNDKLSKLNIKKN